MSIHECNRVGDINTNAGVGFKEICHINKVRDVLFFFVSVELRIVLDFGRRWKIQKRNESNDWS